MKGIRFTRLVLHSFFVLVLFSINSEELFSQGHEAISITSLQNHMYSIASDDTEGRFTGTPGYKKAADYAVNFFRDAGLQPGWTNEKGELRYLQPVPFLRYSYDTNTFLTIQKNGNYETFAHSMDNFIVLTPGLKNSNFQAASPVFIGYGIHEPENGWDDYEGVEVKGKWVILLNGRPPVDLLPAFPVEIQKEYAIKRSRDSLVYQALVKHKVAGVIALPSKNAIENWEYEAPRKSHFKYLHYDESDVKLSANSEIDLPKILISPKLSEVLFKGQSFNPILGKGNYHSYVISNSEISISINCKKESINCFNVVAILPGTDSNYKNEYITVCAHLDHLGKMGNRVYNGANDDASGCVAILGAANALKKTPTKRPVMFVLHTSEENNLKGSKHFMQYPPIPINHIIVNINLEQIGSKSREFPGIWAIGAPEFNFIFKKVSNSFQGTDFKYDLNESYMNALSGKVDSWNYMKKGIPTVLLSSGGFPEHHKPEDKIDLIDFTHLYRVTNFLYLFIKELGNEMNQLRSFFR